MIGQGRPRHSCAQHARVARPRPWLFGAALVCAVCLLVARAGRGRGHAVADRLGWRRRARVARFDSPVGRRVLRSRIARHRGRRGRFDVARTGRDRNPPAQPTRLRRGRRAHRGRSRRSIDRDAHERSRRTGQAGGDRPANAGWPAARQPARRGGQSPDGVARPQRPAARELRPQTPGIRAGRDLSIRDRTAPARRLGCGHPLPDEDARHARRLAGVVPRL